jgi:hypothetical protein
MIFDTEKQRKIILEILAVVSVAGKDLDEIYAFKQQVLQGTIKAEPKSND